MSSSTPTSSAMSGTGTADAPLIGSSSCSREQREAARHADAHQPLPHFQALPPPVRPVPDVEATCDELFDTSALRDELVVVDSPFASPVKHHPLLPVSSPAAEDALAEMNGGRGATAPGHDDDNGNVNGSTLYVGESATWGGRARHGPRANPCMPRIERFLRTGVVRGGTVSNVYSLASATLGAGIVSVASGFHDSGIVVSVFLLALVGLSTVYSLRLLALTTDKTGLRSYEEMARGLLGFGWDYFTAAQMFIFSWGTCVAYVIAVGDVLETFVKDTNAPEFLKSTGGRRCMMSAVWLVGMLPLSLPKQINSLRYASILGVSFIVFFVFCVIVHSLRNGLRDGFRSDLNLATGGMASIRGLSLFIFAFLNQPNGPGIYEEMLAPTPRTMTRDAAIAMSLVALLNFLSGFFGYCDFGAEVSGSVLLLYRPSQDTLFTVAYLGVCAKVCVGFAICLQPGRDTLYYCLKWGRTADVATKVNWCVSGGFALSALIVGMLVPSITVAFSLMGGVSGGFLGFMFPAYFYMYSGGFTLARVGWLNYVGCLLMLVGGVVALVFCTAASVYAE